MPLHSGACPSGERSRPSRRAGWMAGRCIARRRRSIGAFHLVLGCGLPGRAGLGVGRRGGYWRGRVRTQAASRRGAAEGIRRGQPIVPNCVGRGAFARLSAWTRWLGCGAAWGVDVRGLSRTQAASRWRVFERSAWVVPSCRAAAGASVRCKGAWLGCGNERMNERTLFGCLSAGRFGCLRAPRCKQARVGRDRAARAVRSRRAASGRCST